MSRLRHLATLFVGAAVFAGCLVMFRRAVGFRSPWFGLIVMLSVLGLVALARPLGVLKLPGCLRKNREWETRGKLYKGLGVQAFGAVLRGTPLRYLNPLVYLARGGNRSAVQAQIESAEAAHFLAAGVLIPHMVYACAQKWWGAVAGLMIVQVIGNLYPMLHLRWVRMRIDRIQGRRLSRESGAAELANARDEGAATVLGRRSVP